MMNLVAISLILTSFAASSVWSPSPETRKASSDDIIVKAGHRVVVVEYDEDGETSTKVSISPEHDRIPIKPTSASDVEDRKLSSEAKDVFDRAKDKVEDATSFLSLEPPEAKLQESHAIHGPGELICDAFGKCKHRIATTLGKAKEEVSEKVHRVEDETRQAKDAAEETLREAKESVTWKANEAKEYAKDRWEEDTEHAKDAIEENLRKAKDLVTQKAHGAKEYAGDALESTKETAKAAKERGKTFVQRDLSEATENVKEKAKEAKDAAKESVTQKAYKAKEYTEDSLECTKETANAAKERGKMFVQDVQRDLSEASESVKEKAKEAKDMAKDVKRRTESKLHRTKEMRKHVISQFDASGVTEWLHLMGFATVYGTCMWVTFASSYVLAGALPRQQFGVVQSKLYPVYFRVMLYGIGGCLLGHLLSQRKHLLRSKPEMLQAFNLMSSFLLVLVNVLYLEPIATKVMFERMKLEKEEGRGREHLGDGVIESRVRLPGEALTATVPAAAATAPEPTPEDREGEIARARVARANARLGKLNAYSSTLNILTLMALSWHLVYLSQRLSLAC